MPQVCRWSSMEDENFSLGGADGQAMPMPELMSCMIMHGINQSLQYLWHAREKGHVDIICLKQRRDPTPQPELQLGRGGNSL